jgi:hypothetical protein
MIQLLRKQLPELRGPFIIKKKSYEGLLYQSKVHRAKMPMACHGWCCITSVSFTTLAVLSKMVFIKQMDFLSKMMLFTPFFLVS